MSKEIKYIIWFLIDFILDSQLDLDVEVSQEEDFQVQLKSSYSFKLKPVDLVKLKTIRIAKNEKKRTRLFKEMGLPIENSESRGQNKIFLSKQSQATTVSTRPNSNSNESGNTH